MSRKKGLQKMLAFSTCCITGSPHVDCARLTYVRITHAISPISILKKFLFGEFGP